MYKYKSESSRKRVIDAVIKSNHNRRTKFTYDKMNPELAYILGTYMGDGSICHNNRGNGRGKSGYILSLTVIDIDFINSFKKTIKKILNKEYNIKKRDKGIPNQKPIYSYRVGCSDLCKWILKVTKKKKIIPYEIIESNDECKKQFLIGLMDSECTMCKSRNDKRLGGYSYVLLFGVKRKWCFKVKKMFKDLGVRTGNMYVLPDFLRFSVNIYDYHKAGFYLNIKRKQRNLDDYISYYKKYKVNSWSFKDINFLKKNYSNKFTRDLVEKLNHNRQSIISKAHRLGLKKSKEIISLHRRHAQKYSQIAIKNKKDIFNTIKLELGEELCNGFSDEQILSLFIYSIVSYHRIHPKLSGSSGGGMSHMLNRTVDFIPSEEILEKLTRTSAKYFNYDLPKLEMDK